MNFNLKSNVYIKSLFVLFIIVVFSAIIMKITYRFVSKKYEKYIIPEYDLSYEGKITYIKINRGDIYTEIEKNGIQYLCLRVSNSKYIDNQTLSSLIQIGDYIYKPAHTDSLFLYKNKESFSYQLDIINK